MRAAVALAVLAGSVAAHSTGHSEHENFLRSLHSSNFLPTRVKPRQNDIPPLESLGPALPSEPAVPLRTTPTPGTKSPVEGAPALPAGKLFHFTLIDPRLPSTFQLRSTLRPTPRS